MQTLHTQEQLLETAVRAAREAGKIIVDMYAITDFEAKHDGSPVTLADIRANDCITEILNETGIPILSEESTKIAPPYPDALWIVDPLDGTQDFITKTGDFSVMIGLLENGRPTLSVVYAPILKRMYTARKGYGTLVTNTETEETTPLRIIEHTPGHIRMIRSRHHHSGRAARIAEHINADVVSPRGSVGIKAAVIAEGNADMYLVMGRLGEWDTCAPELLLTEAGGVVCDNNGGALSYGNNDHRLPRGTMFSHPNCAAKIIDALKNILLEE